MTNNPNNDIEIVPTSCLHNCGGRCLLKAHVKDGKIIRIETDNGEQPQLRACARGRAYRQRVYAPDRLLYPLRRVGERGEGRFERISWDEALDIVASNLLKVKDTYGNAAILLLAHSGSEGFIHGKGPVKRLLERFRRVYQHLGNCFLRRHFICLSRHLRDHIYG